MLIRGRTERVYRVAHLACGIGSGAAGFNDARAVMDGVAGRYECAGGIDVDPGAIANFGRLTGVPGTVMDLFSREQYVAFHGQQPPADWREAMPHDVRGAFGGSKPVDVMFISAPCLPGEGPIITAEGIRPIKTARAGQYVLTHRGRMRMITHVGSHMFTGTMYGFRLNGTVDVQRFTQEHPLWVRRVVKRAGKRVLGPSKFMPAKDVRVGDRVGFPIQPGVPGTARSIIEDFGDPQVYVRGGSDDDGLGKKLPIEHEASNSRIVDLRPHAESVNLWYLLGVYAGDGYRNRKDNGVVFCVGARNGELDAEVTARLNELGLSYYHDTHAGDSNVKVITRSLHLHKICSLIDGKASTKQLSHRMFDIEDMFADAFIAGYHAADGCVVGERISAKGQTLRPRWKISSCSLQLLRDIQRLLLRSKKYASIHVSAHGGEQVIEGRTVQSLPRWELVLTEGEAQKRCVHEFEDAAVWVRIRDIAAENVTERVWNLSVDEDDTYCAPLIATHNCKGFSGLLPKDLAPTDKYQALNALTIRCMMLTLEAYRNDPIKIILFENVPLITSEGRAGRQLLDRIQGLLRGYGYVFTESKHDCGEVGGLAQHRRRFLMVARHVESMPPFLYEPHKLPMRPIGDVLGAMPLPGDPRGGPLHRIPELQWKTWSRLAFVKAGRDWRSLADPDMEVSDGRLLNWGIQPLDGPVADVASQIPPGSPHNEVLGVRPWNQSTGTVAGASRPHNGTYSVADPRYAGRDRSSTLGVGRWDEPSGTVTGETHPSNGRFSVADARDAGTGMQRVEHFRVVPLGTDVRPADGNGVLPDDTRRLATRIMSSDRTWHRPLTVLELAALQSLFDPEEIFAEGSQRSFDLSGGSEGKVREWIGNAVPRKAAQGMGETILECLLMSDLGVTFSLSSRAIWVKPLAIDLAVDVTMPGGAFHLDASPAHQIHP